MHAHLYALNIVLSVAIQSRVWTFEIVRRSTLLQWQIRIWSYARQCFLNRAYLVDVCQFQWNLSVVMQMHIWTLETARKSKLLKLDFALALMPSSSRCTLGSWKAAYARNQSSKSLTGTMQSLGQLHHKHNAHVRGMFTKLERPV